jgi:hypothetical protein
MTPEVAQAMMKEWYWGVILAALIAVAFAPSFLKGKCPTCKKRGLRTVDADAATVQRVAESESKSAEARFTVYYRCDRCQARFKRLRTEPLQDASGSHYDPIFLAAS